MSSNALVVYRPQRPRRWGWLLVAAAMLTVAVLGSLALFDAIGLLDGRSLPVTVVIDGEEIGHGFDLAAMTAGHKLALFLGVMLTVLLVTQHIDEIFPEVGRVIVLEAGRIIDDGPKDRVLRGPALADAFGGPLHVTMEDGYYYVRPLTRSHVEVKSEK